MLRPALFVILFSLSRWSVIIPVHQGNGCNGTVLNRCGNRRTEVVADYQRQAMPCGPYLHRFRKKTGEVSFLFITVYQWVIFFGSGRVIRLTCCEQSSRAEMSVSPFRCTFPSALSSPINSL